MSKTIKHTRARALPAKIQLSQRQDLTGSFPSISRTPSDNRTGRYPIVFHDNSTIRFNQKTDSVVYPLLLTPQASVDVLSQQNILDNTYTNGESPITTSGSMVRGVSDIFAERKDYCQQSINFNDYANPEVDAKKTENSFYATGSTVSTTGNGFQQSLWSKNKITIDLTPSSNQFIQTKRSGSSGCYPMAYWNNVTKQYDGLGTGKGIDSYSPNLPGLKMFLSEQVFGFNSSIDVGGPSASPIEVISYGRQISSFGFPYHQKFQANDSQKIQASDFISEPFLVEKIVLQMDCKLQNSYFSNSAIWTFFLLNSRNTIGNKQIGIQEVTPIIGGVLGADFTTSSLSTNTYMDLVDYFQVNFSSSVLGTSIDRELTVVPVSTSFYEFNGQINIESTAKTGFSYSTIPAAFSGSKAAGMRFIPKLNLSGRNQVYEANGRDWRNTFEKPQVIYSYDNGYTITDINLNYTKQNPYILLPTDKLTFGFQLPWSAYGGTSPTDYSALEFSPVKGINKIILYGSTLRINPETNQLEEYHDSLNQILTSNSIHENIEG